MNDINRFLKSYFNFTKGESQAFLLLLFIILVLLILPLFFHSKYSSYKADFTNLYRLSDSMSHLAASHVNKQKVNDEISTIHSKFQFHNFNPNTISKDALIGMGVYPSLADRIVNYRLKVAPFQCKQQLLKVYGLSNTLYSRLSAFIDLPEECPVNSMVKYPSFEKKEKPAIVVNINLADTAQLIALPGIGSKLAQRIINYRDKLGGFLNMGQVGEVWGLRPETIQMIEKQIVIHPGLIKKIPVNTCDIEGLSKHPYCGYKMAVIIVNYRKQHGVYSNLDQLKQLVGVNIESLIKLQSYLSLD
jgi:competence protein ComEA